ncbi:MAG: pyridoxal phosphate-dependent aminotransferase [Anaerolineales bacterium]|nr:pyridoxal phosphate-dependent aminotransferase [Anaerolineales bacterium]
MQFNFDKQINRRGTDSVKWGVLEGMEDLAMWVADMDFLSPPVVKQALLDRVEQGVFGYSMELPEFAQAVVEWMQSRFQWEITPEDVVLSSGVVTGFNQTAHALLKPGEKFLFHTPAYGPFFAISENCDVEQKTLPLIQDGMGEYVVDLQAFEEAMQDNVGLFLLCNPQNPTSRVFTREELLAMADICVRYDVLICADEIHSDLVYSPNKHIPIASLSHEIADRTITLAAPSKTFNIAGLNCSEAIITNPELRDKFRKTSLGLTSHVTGLAQAAAIAAYTKASPWLEELLDYLKENRDFLMGYITQHMPQIKLSQPQGTFMAWLDCGSLSLEPSPAEFFAKNAGVVLNDGKWFGKEGEGFVRLNFGCARSQLEESLDRMKKALESR